MSLSQKHYQVGYSLYLHHQPLTACQNAQQIAGWWAALDADAEAATPHYASRMGF